MPDIINFESAKDRRTDAAIEADQDHWEDVRDYLAATMEASRLGETLMVGDV